MLGEGQVPHMPMAALAQTLSRVGFPVAMGNRNVNANSAIGNMNVDANTAMGTKHSGV